MLLTVENICKSYPGAEAMVLRGVSFDLAAGEMLALTGESGSGKSTLLHLIGGLDTADSGVLAMDGTDLTALDDAGRAAVAARHGGGDLSAVQPDPVADGCGQHRLSGPAGGAA